MNIFKTSCFSDKKQFKKEFSLDSNQKKAYIRVMSTHSYKCIQLRKQPLTEHFYWMELTLSRPERRNAFHPQMIQELYHCAKELTLEDKNWDPQKKRSKRMVALVLKGKGKCFCAGADLEWMQSTVKYGKEENKRDAAQLFEMLQAIQQIPFPTIALVHGRVMGGGLGLMAACDFTLAESGTLFCFSEGRLGLVPAVISPFLLQKGLSHRFLPHVLTAREFDCVEAKSLGLLYSFAPGDFLEKGLEKLILSLQQTGPEALRENKKWLQHLPTSLGLKPGNSPLS